MKEKLVKTISGYEVPIEHCKVIKGDYYLIGEITLKDSGDCYLIGGKHYRSNTGYIEYDHRLLLYVTTTSRLTLGVIDYVDNEVILGSFSSIDDSFNEFEKLVYGKEKLLYSVLDTDKLVGSPYKKIPNDDIYHHRCSIDSILFQKIKECPIEFKRGLLYDSTDRLGTHIKLFNKLYNKQPGKVASTVAKVVNGLSFGVEFESIKGIVNQRLTDKLGLIPLRDGSIAGLEYVTIPLEGAKGIQALIDSTKLLKKTTTYDNNCSLHIHIGNIPRTEKFFLAMFRVLCIVQDEMFAMFPPYKKENNGIKRKHYTKPFNLISLFGKMDNVIKGESSVKKNFGILYTFLSMGQNYKEAGQDLSNVDCHPSDPRGEHKWNIRTRYYWSNLIPLLFGNKQTVEFRVHTATYDSEKILYYLMIISALVNYAKNNTEEILTNPRVFDYGLYDILYRHFDTLSGKNMNLLDYTNDYIQNRKRYISNCVRNKDILAEEDNFIYKKGPLSSGYEDTIKIKFGSGLYYNNKLRSKELEEILRAPNPYRPQRIGRIEIREVRGMADADLNI